MKKIKIFDTEIIKCEAQEFKKSLVRDLRSGKEQVCFGKVNTEFLLRTRNLPEFQETLRDFKYNIADGKGVLWSAKYLTLPLTKIPLLRQIQAIWQMIYTGASLIIYPSYCRSVLPENIPGLDAMFLTLEAIVEADIPVYFFGGPRQTLEKSVEIVNKKYPRLKLVGFAEGYNYKDDDVVRDINKSGAEALFVFLGSPKQEFWIRDNLKKLINIKLAVGEGGTLEYIAGDYKRAPKWMQKVGIEWFWRLFMNKNKTAGAGGRGKRVWQAVPVFIYETVRYKIEESK